MYEIKNLEKAKLDDEVFTKDEKEVIKYYRMLKEVSSGNMRLFIDDKVCRIDFSPRFKVRIV